MSDRHLYEEDPQRVGRPTRARVIPLNLRVNALARGARMVVFPAQPKQRRPRPQQVTSPIPGVRRLPEKICEAPHPDIYGIACMGKADHRGKHRARILTGLTFRWSR